MSHPDYSLTNKFVHWPIYCLFVGKAKYVLFLLGICLVAFGICVGLSEVILEQTVIALEAYEMDAASMEQIQSLVLILVFLCAIPVILVASAVSSAVIWAEKKFLFERSFQHTFKALPLFVKSSVVAAQGGIYLAIGPAALVAFYALLVKGKYGQDLEYFFITICTLAMLYLIVRSLRLVMIPVVSACGAVHPREAISVVRTTMAGARNLIVYSTLSACILAAALCVGINYLPIEAVYRLGLMITSTGLVTWYLITALSFLACEGISIYTQAIQNYENSNVALQEVSHVRSAA